ncbi:MAG: beta galactosidase jelly roll domain-containing protein [Saprospiraceae bacterium]|nr:beta galactosidase jelly roll domain-containing protein [Saprospiraceae bacterium]
MPSINRIAVFVIVILLVIPVGLAAQRLKDKNKQEKKEVHWLIRLLYGDESKPSQDAELNVGSPFRTINLSKQWKFHIGDDKKWLSPSYNDSKWERIKVPSSWENQGFHGYDGYAWYRIHFDGRTLEKNQTHFLIPGIIDDVDVAYLNGQVVGKSGSFPPKYRTAYHWTRRYYIPGRMINFEGNNVVAIRVYDHHGRGGITGGNPGIYSSFNRENLLQDLYGEWKFINRDIREASKANYEDSSWREILVPSRWENQGYRSYDGIGWYRKSFTLNFVPEDGKNYFLLLGKIDDLDVAYLNGQRIGSTLDKRHAWKKYKTWSILRVYKIPKGLLKVNGINTIAVQVIDKGGLAGIYEGPIGIIDEENLTRTIR